MSTLPASPLSDSARHRRALLIAVPLGMALDWGLGQAVIALKLPFFLGSVGTIAITLLCGWRFGAVVGVFSSLLSVLFNSTIPYFVGTDIAIALVVGISASHGGFKSVPRIILTGVILGFICALVSAPAVSFAFPGPILQGQSAFAAHLRDTVDYLHHAFASRHIWEEPADKVLQCLLAFGLIRALPKIHRQWLSSPSGYLAKNGLT